MQLNSNGKLAQWYLLLANDGASLPEDFCTFFWGLVGRTLVLLSLCGALLTAIIVAIVYAAIFAWAHKMPIAILFVIGLIIAFGIWFQNRKKKRRFEFLDEVKTIIETKVDSIKNRYCPRIEWEATPPPK